MPDLPQQINHPSYEEAIARTEGRKDILEDILVESSKTKETLDLRCEKKDC